MRKNVFYQKIFYDLLKNKKLKDAYYYLLKTNNIDLLIRYQKKMKKFKRVNSNMIYSPLINEINKKYYYMLLESFQNEKIYERLSFYQILKNIPNNCYYIIYDEDLLIWECIEEVVIDIRILECLYSLKINIISNIINYGFINYLSFGKIKINSFVYNKQLYITKSFYNRNTNSKKFKLFLIYYAQYIYDLNKGIYNEIEINNRCTKLVNLYKNVNK